MNEVLTLQLVANLTHVLSESLNSPQTNIISYARTSFADGHHPTAIFALVNHRCQETPIAQLPIHQAGAVPTLYYRSEYEYVIERAQIKVLEYQRENHQPLTPFVIEKQSP